MKRRELFNTILSIGLALSLALPTNVLAQEDIEEETIVEVEEGNEEEYNDSTTDSEEMENSCGTDAFYSVEGFILTISGTGKVSDISGWKEYQDSLEEVIIEEGITSLPSNAFRNFSSLTSVTIPSSMEYVGSLCFDGCSQDLIVKMDEEMDTSSWAEDWKCALDEEISFEEENEVIDEHWHITEEYEGSTNDRYTIHIDGSDCFVPGESKSYTATLYETVNGVSQKVEGATYVFSENSNYVSFTKNSGNTCTVNVNASALEKGVAGFYLWCDVTYGTYKEQGWKYVFIENEYFSLDIDGMSVNTKGNYEVDQGRLQLFTIRANRHYNSGGSLKVVPVSTDEDINFDANNIEIYDGSMNRVYTLKADQTYTMKHTANSIDIISFHTWIKNSSGDPVECTKDITVESTCKYIGYSLSLSGNIAVNYYMALSNSLATDAGAYMLFTMPDGTTSRVYVKDAAKSVVQGEECYIFPHSVSAKDMTSIISSHLIDGNGNLIEQNTYSIEQYVNSVLSNVTSYSQKDINIAKAMMTYGYYTQKYFGYRLSNLPVVVNPLADVSFNKYAYSFYKENDSVKFSGARLVLTSKPGLKLYFQGGSGFKVNGVNAAVTTEGKYTVVTISNIDRMDTMYTITGDSFSLTYGIFSFANQVQSTSGKTDLLNLMKAMHAYNEYFK